MNIPYGIKDIEVFVGVIDSGSFKETGRKLNRRVELVQKI